MPKLLMASAGKTRQVDLKPHENALGRSAQNDVVLSSTFASRQHAVIVVGSAFTTIRDLQSLNGTFVNGVRVETQVLAEGDIVHLEGCELRFQAAEQDFTEIEAQGLSSIPSWVNGPGARKSPAPQSRLLRCAALRCGPGRDWLQSR